MRARFDGVERMGGEDGWEGGCVRWVMIEDDCATFGTLGKGAGAGAGVGVWIGTAVRKCGRKEGQIRECCLAVLAERCPAKEAHISEKSKRGCEVQ